MQSKDRLYLQAWLEQRLSESADALAITLGVPTADVLAVKPVIEVRGSGVIELADVRREYNAALEVGLRDQRRADSAEAERDRLKAENARLRVIEQAAQRVADARRRVLALADAPDCEFAAAADESKVAREALCALLPGVPRG